MPNWCTNEVDIYGPKEDLIKFLTDIGFYDGEEFSLNRIIPMPEELQGIHTGYSDKDGQESNHWRELPDGTCQNISIEELNTLFDTCGATNWYDWALKYWGIKWDVSVVEYYSDDPATVAHEEAEMCLSLETAWGPPEEFYKVIVHKYPTLSFTWFYKEEGMQIAGWLGK